MADKSNILNLTLILAAVGVGGLALLTQTRRENPTTLYNTGENTGVQYDLQNLSTHGQQHALIDEYAIRYLEQNPDVQMPQIVRGHANEHLTLGEVIDVSLQQRMGNPNAQFVADNQTMTRLLNHSIEHNGLEMLTQDILR